MKDVPAVSLEVELVEARTARARWAGGQLRVRLPRHWPASEREAALARFTRWAEQRQGQEAQLDEAWMRLHAQAPGRRWGQASLERHVREVNEATLQAPLRAVRLGEAKRSRLAQCNPQTRVLTFSCHAVDGLPMAALRYLILHELAHLFEANHSPRFWAHVARFEPRWRELRPIAQHHHAKAVAELGRAGPPFWAAVGPPPPLAAPKKAELQSEGPRPLPSAKAWGGHPFDALYRFVPRPYAPGAGLASVALTAGTATEAGGAGA